MPNSTGRFAAVTGTGWVLLAIAAAAYSSLKHLPAALAVPVALAFLIEFPFYLLPAFQEPLNRLAPGRGRLALLLTASALLPYLTYSLPTGLFLLPAFLALAAIAAFAACWYLVFPASPLSDSVYLLCLAALILTKSLDRIYLTPFPRVPISILGHIMLVRTAALAVLRIRGGLNVEFRFIPRPVEWLAGFRYFLLALPFLVTAYWALGLVRLRPHPLNFLLALGTFLGILWVVALSEEFFFRGILQHALERATGQWIPALAGASVLFGSAHLWFHRFPNWRFAIVAAIAGIFYGLAWRKTRTIQSGMVTHALTVTLWRVFFQ